MKKHPAIESLENRSGEIGVVGLGYVGLPLAMSFAKKFKVVGFDINERKISELHQGIDTTGEVEDLAQLKSSNVTFSSDPACLKNCPVIIVAVPTPVDQGNKPDLRPLIGASQSVGKAIANSKAPVYICFESTVYPGCTEEDCLPIIEKASGKKHGKDFFLGYSPERINPGDKVHRFETIKKVVSGCCAESLSVFSQLYRSVVTAGIYEAATIRVAEAAKVIENTQRDLNIALVNELSVIFSRLGIDTRSVLEAAGTKWNFLPFVPGLVGGHCIGVDPYYLTYKAECTGYRPQVILAGRSINDSMGSFVATEGVKRAIKVPPKSASGYSSLVLGFTFKENVPDVRNTKVVDVISTLRQFSFAVDVIDPVGDRHHAAEEYGIEISEKLRAGKDFLGYDLIVLAVAHEELKPMIADVLQTYAKSQRLVTFIDVKGYLSKDEIASLPKNINYWRL